MAEAGTTSSRGWDGSNDVTGAEGDDMFFVYAGSTASLETITGGPGTDLVNLASFAEHLYDPGYPCPQQQEEGWTVDLAGGTGRQAYGAMAGFSGIEDVIGSPADDVITGDDADNVLVGGCGDDRLDGRGGIDALFGDEGADECLNGERVEGCEATRV